MSQQEQEERPPAEEKKPEETTDTRSIFERVKERRAKQQERQSKRKQYNSLSTGANEYSARMTRIQLELDELKILYRIRRDIDELLLKRKESLRSESLI